MFYRRESFKNNKSEEAIALDKLNKSMNKNRPELKQCKELNDEITCNSVERCQWEDGEESGNKCQLVEYFNSHVKSKKNYKITNNTNHNFVCLSIILTIGLIIIVYCRKKKYLY
jgi:hypothetical protein